MATKVGANGQTVVHKDSGGTVSFMPDVCKTPAPPGPPIPIPYPNVAKSADAAKGASTVLVDGNPLLLAGSQFSKSTGDEGGSAGGVASSMTQGPAEFVSYSFDVIAEGKGVARANDLMLGNKGGGFNTPPAPLMQPPLVASPVPVKDVDDPDRLDLTAVGEDGKPLADVEYEVDTTDGRTLKGKTDGSGKIRVNTLPTGICRIRVPSAPEAILAVVP
ncbi:MAG: hypothetical protein A2V77_18135 [Anaeromyxobacter sp. RBG_16_69_14]|nr:MAG: hypothetical protein A2V77_18135 [Anaeromyxobacter sp. RBG_16_69_14]